MFCSSVKEKRWGFSGGGEAGGFRAKTGGFSSAKEKRRASSADGSGSCSAKERKQKVFCGRFSR